MPIWLNTRGKSTLGIGMCDRCHFKYSLDDLVSDGNAPGLRVCVRCCDVFDPYRLPARQPDDITLPFYRPDDPIESPQPERIIGFGVLYSPVSVIQAQGVNPIHYTGTGAMVSPIGTIAGVGTWHPVSVGIGALTSSPGSIAAAGVVGRHGSGAVNSPASLINAAAVAGKHGSGALTSPSSAMEGAGTVSSAGGPQLFNHTIHLKGGSGSGNQEPYMHFTVGGTGSAPSAAQPPSPVTLGSLAMWIRTGFTSILTVDSVTIGTSGTKYTGTNEWWSGALPGPASTYEAKLHVVSSSVSSAFVQTFTTLDTWITMDSNTPTFNFEVILFSGSGTYTGTWELRIRRTSDGVEVAIGTYTVTVATT